MRLWGMASVLASVLGAAPKVADPATTEMVMTFLSPQETQALGGIPGEAVAGAFVGGRQSLDNFRPNRVFIDFMHQVIRTAGPEDPEMKAVARRQGEGSVTVIDLRTPEGPMGNVPPEDIIGIFGVHEGRIAPSSYEASPKYRVLTPNGLVHLPPSLRAAFVKALPHVHEGAKP